MKNVRQFNGEIRKMTQLILFCSIHFCSSIGWRSNNLMPLKSRKSPSKKLIQRRTQDLRNDLRWRPLLFDRPKWWGWIHTSDHVYSYLWTLKPPNFWRANLEKHLLEKCLSVKQLLYMEHTCLYLLIIYNDNNAECKKECNYLCLSSTDLLISTFSPDTTLYSIQGVFHTNLFTFHLSLY